MVKKILILAAHPDYETLGCGATIKKLSDQGNYIKLITFTDGEGSRDNNMERTSIVGEVCKFLGINDYVCGDFPDNKMDSVSLLDLVKFIEENVDFVPDLIYTHWEHCNNIDHELVYRATITAFRPQTGNNIKIYSYFVPSSSDYNTLHFFNGVIYENVKNTSKYKLECLTNFYKDELRKYPHTRSIENIENLMKVWGSEVGLEYAATINFSKHNFVAPYKFTGETHLSVDIPIKLDTFCLMHASITFCVPKIFVLIPSPGLYSIASTCFNAAV